MGKEWGTISSRAIRLQADGPTECGTVAEVNLRVEGKERADPEPSCKTGFECEDEDVVELEEEGSSKEPKTEEEVTSPISRLRIVTQAAEKSQATPEAKASSTAK